MGMPALILALLLAPAISPDGPALAGGEESAKKIKELQKERIATLKQLVDGLAQLAPHGRADFGELIEARLLLLQAELDVAEKGEDRLALYKKAIESLGQYEQWANARVQAGRANTTTVLKIKARRLEAQIWLEQAKAKEATPSK
jgi:hypothetical protein